MSSFDGEISYSAWGSEFFAQVVTTERVLAGLAALAGQPIDVKPIGVGPGKLVKVMATGEIGTPTGDQVGSNPSRFAFRLPVTLQFTIDLGMDKHHFDANITVPLTIVARARGDLAIVLDVTPPTAGEVVVDLKARGLRASITQHAANVEGELKRFVAKYVAREIDKPHVLKARVIDVSAAIDRAMDTLGLGQESPSVAADVAADFDVALEAELQERQQVFLDGD